MYSEELISFFKKYNLYEFEMFEYLKERTDFIDYRVVEDRIHIGCSYKINKKNNKVVGLRICVPFCMDEKTTLISIHEIAHGIYGYKHLNKKINSLELELLPMLLERLYIEERKNKELEEYAMFLDSTIDSSSEEQYRFALENRETIKNAGFNDYNSFDKQSMKLIRLWKQKKQVKT